MRLPSDYRTVVIAGADALRGLGARVRAEIAGRRDASELWLTVRDLEGLADRLAAPDEAEWRGGFADMFITGQDLGVLGELLAIGVRLTDARAIPLTPVQKTTLADLLEFLQRYADRMYESDEPPT